VAVVARRTRALRALLVCACSAVSASARAEDSLLAEPLPSVALGVGNPYAPMVSGHLYAQLYRSPARAFGYELLAPGLGFAYAGFKAQAIVSAAATLLGAGLWVAGATTDHDALRYVGIGTFAAARGYGAVGAPTAAALLNAAFRRRLGIAIAIAY
jgi:hypothetical protein